MAKFDPDEYHVKKWHPWLDRPGTRYLPVWWDNPNIHTGSFPGLPLFSPQGMEELINVVTRNELFVLCNDILDVRDFEYANELIGDKKRATPYLTRTGSIVALRLHTKRRSGFLIPGSVWKWDKFPDRELVDNLQLLFRLFGFQSTTPASLSEKVLRSTLPTPLNISRPSANLRQRILDNHIGGRIDKSPYPSLYPFVVEYDKNKAYLHHSRNVPSPYYAPTIRTLPHLDESLEYATGWWHVTLIAHQTKTGIHPIQVNGQNPVEGEVIDTWLWTMELQNCLDAGYSLSTIQRGYAYKEMSNFMEHWSDILWKKYLQAQTESEHVLKIIKAMMVGLPGRFLRQPETYTLVHISERQEGDIPLLYHWHEPEDTKFTDYMIRPEYDKESTALSPQGSYIVAAMRSELYHMMNKIVESGGQIVDSYIDCIRAVGIGLDDIFDVGTSPGQWKRKIWRNGYAEENRFVGELEDPFTFAITGEMVAPGFSAERRIAFWERYRQFSMNSTFST